MNTRTLACLLAAVAILTATRATAEQIDYLREVKPLFEGCFACHGALRQQADLRLDTAEFMRRGGESGPAIEPGQPDQSVLIWALTGSEGYSQMPPEGEGEHFTAEQVERVRQWIASGAPAPADEPIPQDPRQHWAFQTPQRPAMPAVTRDGWARNPIDLFVAARHSERGLKPAPEAERALLLRRVYLDLIGLPPSPEELAAFLADASPDAYERVVDRLLDSPRYGERWGRHWMDVWRYSDWAGYRKEIRESQYHIWRWRDWIIESLNADKPYDRMVVEMLAGDEIAPTDADVLRATGYLGRNWFKFNRNVWLDNTVEYTGKSFLGLTLNCARCHAHKYDPIEHADYYRFRAFFEPHQVRYDPLTATDDPEQVGLSRAFDQDLAAVTYRFERGNEKRPDKSQPLAPRLPEVFSSGPLAIEPMSLPVAAYYPELQSFRVEGALRRAAERVAKAEAGRQKRDAQLAAAQQAGMAEAELAAKESAAQVARLQLNAAQLTEAALRIRVDAERVKYGLADGDHASLAAQAAAAEREAAVAEAEAALATSQQKLVALGDSKENEAARKRQQQVVDEAEKKLTAAREALKKTDSQYSPLGPVHSDTSSGRRLALARWIASPQNPLTARVAVNHIWLRHFGSALVPTVFDFGNNGQRPTHPQLLDYLACELIADHWQTKPLHRMIVTSSTYRMSSSHPRSEAMAEVDPDNHLLWKMNHRRMEAEIVRDSVLSVAGSLDFQMGGPELDQEAGQTEPRRSVYFRHAYEKRMKMLELFDGPGVVECYQRDESIVPQQALALANSPLVKEQSRHLARRLSQDIPAADSQAFVQRLFISVLSRRPTTEEAAACLEFLDSQTRQLGAPDQLTPAGHGKAARLAGATDPVLRARENLAHVLINHNDFVTIR